MILTLGAGNIWQLGPRLLEELQQPRREGPSPRSGPEQFS